MVSTEFVCFFLNFDLGASAPAL